MRFILISSCLLTVLMSATFSAAEDSSEIYSRRVLPLLRSPAGSSCQECHFSGIELTDFLSENEVDSFARLRADGWIDAERPRNSKLLTFVHRHGEKTSKAIEELRQKESTAIADWIAAAASNPALMRAKPASDTGIELDRELIRHLRSDQVQARFLDNIWAELGRCINCHSPERNESQVKEHGEQMSWIVPHDPATTLDYLVENGLIDIDDPEQSEIRTKPTELVKHGGGPKFPIGSASDKRFLSFLRDYARVVEGHYTSVDQLPKSNDESSLATEHHLRLTNLPEAWSGKLMRVDLYERTGTVEQSDGWSGRRVATADSKVNVENQMWQNSMCSVTSRDQTPRESLGSTRYLARIYVDLDDRLNKDPDEIFRDEDLMATLEFGGDWAPGWREPMIVDAQTMKKTTK